MSMTVGDMKRIFAQIDDSVPLTFASADGVVDIDYVCVARLINPATVYSSDDSLFADVLVLAAKQKDFSDQGLVNQRNYFRGDK